ncbi:multiple RNA-binding domain-containing protein 1 [Plakobranchus ocellatus]|uniref:Multiple RNA-binding domain-containing protein 1 n=1 Tax=Plakobranchus ocellatus TaxID=259542 RepID=A0AAV4BL73_9GAST|nr:multiple RNA-binding domain-containing protein 1 [Plakobranchus ocellatus]
MSTRIFVKNLPKDATQEKLVSHIKKSCPTADITDCQLKYTRDGVFRRFAFVGFNSPEEAVKAQAKLNGTFIKTTKILVDLAADIGDASIRAWSKYSPQNQPKTGKAGSDKPFGKEAKPEEVKSTRPGFAIKMKGLSGFYNEKSIRDFFKPIKLSSIRIPKTAQKKPMGVAFVEFATAKELDQGMGRNKNFINGKKIFLKKSAEAAEQAVKPVTPAPWELKAKASSTQEVESIAESGRLFVRNLWFGVTEEELQETFEKFGPLAEVTVPVDPLTKKVKGFAHVVFVFPEHALKAFTELDYTSLHGRLMHILPGRETTSEETGEDEKSSYKKKKAAQQKGNSSSAYNWNSLFLGANAVADAMAKKYNTDKSNILDDESKGSVGVRMALGETQIVSETRQFLISNGVALDSFSQAAGERSKTVILVKNLPAGVEADELREIFSKHGTVNRVLMPPSGITAIIEYIEPSEARQGFMKLNFSKFRSIPLYLEWAPMGVFVNPAKSQEGKAADQEKEKMRKGDNEQEMEDVEKEERKEQEDIEQEADKNKIKEKNNNEEDEVSEEEPEENTTIFVKNLNFDTADQDLSKHFEKLGELHSATVAKKKDVKRPGELLSMGYGFVQYMKQRDAKEALKHLQNSVLDEHNLELKMSNRTTPKAKGRKKQGETKQTSTKILVRNIPFEAKKREIEELFKVFGELKFVRLPKKLGGTGPHRGFAFVDFLTKQDAKRAFNALCHSTHLYGRRLVLEWAEAEESLEELRKKTAKHFPDEGPRKKVSRTSLKNELDS